MRLWTIALYLSWMPTFGLTQLAYSPGMNLVKNIPLSYYNTEYIFVQNTGANATEIFFELVSENVPAEWNATGCTSQICYIKIPDYGSLGVLASGEEGYLSINLSVNEVEGDAEIKFAVYSENNPSQKDTISFIYHAHAPSTEPQPWVKLNLAENVVTVFLENESIETHLYVFSANGEAIIELALTEAITSTSLKSFATGIYIAVIRQKSGRIYTQKIVVS